MTPNTVGDSSSKLFVLSSELNFGSPNLKNSTTKNNLFDGMIEDLGI